MEVNIMIRNWAMFSALAFAGFLVGQWPPIATVACAQVPGADTIEAATKADPEPPAQTEIPEARQPASLRSARQALLTFVGAIERQDYRTAITVLDFSAINPTPDSLEQLGYAQRLKACMDRMALVDRLQFSDAPDGPPVSFPPDRENPAIFLSRGEDELWRFTAETVAEIDSMYEVLADQPIIGAEPTSADKPPAEQESAKETTPEPSDDENGKDSEQSDSSSVPEELQSARRTMHTLFDSLENRDYGLAVAALDFSLLETENPALGPYARLTHARRLKDIIDRIALVNYAMISDDPHGPPVRFPPDQVNKPIEIERDETGTWRFSAKTVERIDSLYKLHANKPVLNLPEEERPWYEHELMLGNEVWRILTLFAALFASLLVGHTVRGVSNWRATTLERGGHQFRSAMARTVATSAVGILFLVGLSAGMSGLILDHDVQNLVATVIHVIFSVVIGYVFFRLVDVVVEMLHELAKRSGSTLSNMLAPIISTALRLTIIALVLLEIATAISDQPPSAVLAGLGAGGLAIGLAAQETIRNLFGSVMIFADRPFEIGDRIVLDGHDGPVESVGFRSTRIRTLDGHLITVPNGEAANKTIQNIGKRPYIRRVMNIRVAYDTPPEKVRRALAILRELLADHDCMRDELPSRVFLDDFLETAINIRAIYWFHPPEYWDYCEFGEQLNLQLIERFRADDIGFALPSQRLFIAGDSEKPIENSPAETQE